MFERIHELLKRISTYAVWVSGAALMISAIIVTVDVVLRKFVGWTMSGSDEVTSYVFAAGTTWSYSYCLLHRANIRIDAVYNLLPVGVRNGLDLVGVFLLLLYMGVLTDRAVVVLQDTIENGSVSNTTLTTPLWIPQLAWLGGLIMFMITLIFVAAYAATAMLKRDSAAVTRIAGILSIEEEIEEETRGTGADSGRQAGGT
jgi:TRAP-type C4-dicarboxylate transport system permease small subunit